MTDDFVKGDNIHLAIIPDGNRRYAEKRKLPVWEGHMAGAKKIWELMNWVKEYNQIKTVSIYGLSTENLGRNSDELHHLWEVYKRELIKIKNSDVCQKNGIKINVLGTEDIWGEDLKQAAKDVTRITAQYSRKVVNIMLSYGSQFEILNAVRKVMEQGIKKTKILKELFNEYLMVSQPVDLIIRTGNQQRLSNFMLYQSAYAEIYFSKTMWPDFSKREFDRIITWYFRQQKKFGK
jgi:undecaprenyl diphosphate synthase